MSEELKPCPFCGGNDIAISADENQGNKWGSAVCFSCSAVGPEVRTGYETYPEASWRGEAAAEWNRRAPMTALTPAGEERARALEEAAKVAEEMAGNLKHLGATIYPHVQIGSHLETCKTIAAAIRSLSPTDGAPANPPKVRTP